MKHLWIAKAHWLIASRSRLRIRKEYTRSNGIGLGGQDDCRNGLSFDGCY